MKQLQHPAFRAQSTRRANPQGSAFFILATLILLFYNSGVLYAQHNVEYHFTDNLTPHLAGEYYLSTAPEALVDGTGDTTMNLTMECLAANGYGQWTVSSTTANSASTEISNGWFLLSNSLFPIYNSTHPASQRGATIMSKGYFNGGAAAFPTEPKVTANLLGSVRYAWPDRSSGGSGGDFIVQGLNDSRGSSGDQEIDISFPTQTASNPAATLYPVQSPIHNYTVASVGGATISTAGSDYRDRFDITCDAKYLYIVWRSEITTGSGAGIYYMARNLSDNSIAQSPIFVGAGYEPTVACDVRNAPSSPKCVTTYLSAIGTGTVQFNSIDGSTVSSPSTLSQYFPVGSTTATTYSPLHARVLVSSGATSMGSPSITFGVYVIIIKDGTHNSLVLHKFSTGGSVAKYADGPELNAYADYNLPQPHPLITGADDVIDEPICAFANPYDGQNQVAPNFNQFHCLYRLKEVTYSDPLTSETITQNYPLLIIRGWDNGQSSTDDTRLAVSQTGTNTLTPANLVQADKFVGAVNQAGIHVHWRTTATNTHYYSRDVRRYDENIEENTILTFKNVVGDGSSHSGTVGARVLGGVEVSMWCDPNSKYYNDAGASYTNGEPELILMDQNCNFKVGDDGIAGASAYFTTMPCSDISAYTDFTMTSDDYDYSSSHQSIVNPNSYLDYRNYRGSLAGWPGFNLSEEPTDPPDCSDGAGGLSVELNGYDGANPAYLFTEPGANFTIGYHGTFSSSYGVIAFQNGYSVSDPYHSGSSLVNAYGYFVGTTSLLNSDVTSSNPSGSAAMFTLLPCHPATGSLADHYPCSTASTQFSASHTSFGVWNAVTSSAGLATIQFVGNSSSLYENPCSFDNCLFLRTQVYASDFVSSFAVTNSTFDYMLNAGIYLARSGSVSTYGSVVLQNNTFEKMDYLSGSDPLCAVFLNGYSSSAMENIDIENNTFSASYTPSTMNYAIVMQNSKGGIIHNTITGDAYQAGIWQTTGTLAPATGLNSLICMNRISGCVGAGSSAGLGFGIRADNYSGYTKLNQISTSDIGYISDKSDRGHIIFSNFYDNDGPGLNIVDNSSQVDLAGVHGPTSGGPDYAAYDTIESNTTSEIATVSGSLLRLGNNSIPWTWTYYCENNIIGTDSYPDLISSSGGTTNLYSIDQNYWGGVDPNASSAEFPSISYNTPVTVRGGMTSAPFVVSCGDGLDIVGPRISRLSTLGGPVLTCAQLFELGNAFQVTGQYEQSYDTLKYYVEHCANDTGSFHAFSSLDEANGGRDEGDTNRYVQYRNWLKSVLYLNVWDDNYFCDCVESIANSNNDQRSWLRVIQYLIQNGKCSADRARYVNDYNGGRQHLVDDYLNSGVDTSKVKFDSTLPSLHELGLDTLLNKENVGVPASISIAFGTVHVSDNPFDQSTDIILDLHSTAYVRFAIYDELGRNIQGEETGHVYDPGMHSFHVDGSKLANGVYYARLSTPVGEVRTVKMVKRD